MARLFNGTTDSAVTASIAWGSLPAGVSLAVSFWLWWDAYAADDKRCVFINTSGAGGSWDSDPNSSIGGAVHLFGQRNPGISWIDEFPRPSAAAWHHYLLISTRPPNQETNWAYVDGVAQTLTVGNHSAGLTSTMGNGPVKLMSQTGFAAGRLQELAIWQSNLVFSGTSNQLHSAQALAAGCSPLSINQGQLLAYWPLGVTSPEPCFGPRNLITINVPFTLTGTTLTQPRGTQSAFMGISGG